MQQEIIALGHDVHLVGINATTALEYQGTLSNVCSFPFLQDTAATDAFAAMGGAKDDIYVYRSNGTLAVYLKNGGAINTNLSTGEGYSNVRDMLLAVEEEN
jgi:hypothetical protein